MNTRGLLRAAALATAAASAGILLTRRLARRSGATTAEVFEPFPGDELVREPQIETTRAITIDVPAAEVWPWVAQVGYHRGGWYTDPRLDRLIWHVDNPTTDRILPQFQHLSVGDTVPDGPEGTARFTVAAISPGQLLALYDPGGTHIPDTQFSWVFLLRELDAGHTRLILRTRAAWARRWWMTPLAYLALGPADFLMAHVMLLRGIKLRAERAHQQGAASGTPAPDAGTAEPVTAAAASTTG